MAKDIEYDARFSFRLPAEHKRLLEMASYVTHRSEGDVMREIVRKWAATMSEKDLQKLVGIRAISGGSRSR